MADEQDAGAPAPPEPRAPDSDRIGQDALDVAAATMAPERRPEAGALDIVGRDADLHALDNLVPHVDDIVITESASAAGQGGLGKSWLARAYAELRRPRWPEGPVVVSLTRPDRAGIEFAAAGLRTGFADSGTLSERVQATVAGLRDTPGWLLILDDCPDRRSFHAVRPAGGPPKTLVTASRAPWAADAGAGQYPLGPLDYRDAARICGMHRPDLKPDLPEPARLAAALDEVPEALALAARTLAAQRDGEYGDPIAYINAARKIRVDNLRLSVGAGTRAPAGREIAIVRAVGMAAASLRATHGPDITALYLLRIASAFMPGRAFPARLLRQAAQGSDEPPDQGQVTQALDRLRALGLIRDDGAMGGLYVPRLVAAYVAGNDMGAMPRLRRLAEGAAARLAADALMEGRVNTILPWQTHLHHLAEIADLTRSPYAGVLMRRLGEQMHGLGEPDLAQALDAHGNALIESNPPG
jgi:hypothetical protein